MAEYRARIPFAADLSRLVKAGIEADTDGLRTFLLNMIRANTPPQREVFIKPNVDGTWPTQTRSLSNPGTLMWLRHIGDTGQLAPMPTQADGYIPGDLVAPGPDTTTNPTSENILFSDSFSVTKDANLSTRTGDAYAGGTAPVWVGDVSKSTSGEGRVRVMSPVGLNMYDNVWCRVTAPTLPTTGTWKVSFLLTELAVDNSFNIVLRSPAYNDTTARTILKFANSGGLLVVSLYDSIGGTTTIGQATFTAGSTIITATFDGSTISVTVDGTTLPVTQVPTTHPRLPEFVFHTPGYRFFSVRDLKVATL